MFRKVKDYKWWEKDYGYIPAITFDDIVLVPQYSELESRKMADTSVSLFDGCSLKIPIIAANMSTTCGPDMVNAMYQNGGLGILHRYASALTIYSWIKQLKQIDDQMPVVPSIGVQNEDVDNAKLYIDGGATALCIDIAHGDSSNMVKIIGKLPMVPLIAGNIVTFEAAKRLANLGVKVIKVGVGPGAACSTRTVTGHGLPQLTAIAEVARIKKEFKDVTVIADGGIRNSGDIVKCLAFGADAVMIGRLFAGTEEAPSIRVNKAGQPDPQGQFKKYMGMASAEAQNGFKGYVSGTPEGISTIVPFSGPIEKTLNDLTAGIRSGMSYSGAFTLQEFREKAEYALVTQSGYMEGLPKV